MVEWRLVLRPEGIGVSCVAWGVLRGLVAAGRTTSAHRPQQGQVSVVASCCRGVVHGMGVPNGLTQREGQRAGRIPL